MPTAPADPSAMSAATRGDRAFAVALHEVLRKQPGNLFFSPASVRLAMAMISMGARGETAAELSRGLGLPADAAAAAAGFAAVLESFAQRSRSPVTPQMQEWERQEALGKVSTVAIANRVWPQAGRAFEPAFEGVMARSFAAPMQPLDFARNAEAARKTINAWVAEQTAQKIPQLLQPSNVPASTKLILTNAIYFKAQWEEPFAAQLTKDAEFTTAKGTKVKVPMMSRTGSFRYAETPDYQAVQLPYSDGSLSLTVLLPRAGKPLAAVEAAALTGALDGTPALAGQRVAVQLPRFKIEARFSLAAALAQLGMASAFQFGPADFSGIDGTRELFIGDVVHQAIIEVDEEGTEAAAATAIGMRAGSAMPTAPPRSFIADRPFAFFLQDARTGVVLFMGRVADPTAK
jgi:serpin B